MSDTTEQAARPVPLTDPRLFVLYWLSLYNITVDESGQLLNDTGKTNEEVFSSLWLDYRSQFTAFNANERRKAKISDRIQLPIIYESDMLKALNELVAKEKVTHRKDTIASIACEKEDLEPLKKWVKAVTGSDDQKLVAIFAHWICSCKRKMGNLPVVHIIVPVLVGTQQGGKSFAVNRLVSPIQPYRLNLKLSQLSDERHYKAFGENYVITLDELAAAERSDQESIKAMVTAEVLTYRPMRSNSTATVRNTVSFIGTSNFPLNEKIYDTSGLKRWYQFNTLEKTDWDSINSIDYTALWKGVDENKADAYIKPHLDSIREDQKRLTVDDQIQSYVKERQLAVGGERLKLVKSLDLYHDYTSWALDRGHKPLNHVWFGIRLSNAGIKSNKETYEGKTQNIYRLNLESQVIGQAEPLNFKSHGIC